MTVRPLIAGLFGIAGFSALIAVPDAARAASFDGPWSVTIMTEAGQCDAAYAFPMQIAGGRVIASGGTAMSGRVSGGGAVNVAIAQGGSSGRASGRLSAFSGSGRWSGVLAGSRCSGRWEAMRQ